LGCRSGTPIELEPERFSEGRKRPFGGIGFCGLEGDVVELARRPSAPFGQRLKWRVCSSILGFWARMRGLAQAAGLHRNTVTNLEIGRYAGDPQTLAIIEQVLMKAG
jgi:hypothetical protein